MPPSNPFSFDLYLCRVSEFNPDSFLLCQPDGYSDEGSDPIEALPPGGTWYRPRDPDPETGIGCPMLAVYDGGKSWTMPLLDTRVAPKLGELPKGSFVAYGDTGAAVIPLISIDGDSGLIRLRRDEATEVIVDRGAVSLYTTEDKTETGRPVFFTVRDDGFAWEAPFGRASFNSRGFHVKEHGGARLDIGSLTMPSPIPSSFSTYATLQAAIVSLRAGIVSLGPDTLPRDVIALATPIVAMATALAAFCEAIVPAIATAVVGCVPVTPGPGGPSVVFAGTMAAPLAALSAALGAVPLLTPSKSTSSS